MKGWVLVTGASSGIGRALALRFARDGHRMVLVGRSRGPLVELGREIGEGRTSVIMTDLAMEDGARSAAQASQIRGLEICGLVNAAGFGHGRPFVETLARHHVAAMRVMATAPLELIRTFLPGMLERREGFVLNVASAAALLRGRAGRATYGAAKSALVHMTEALADEHRGSGVRFTAVCPGYVRTGFHRACGREEAVSGLPSFMWREPEDVAEDAHRALMRGTVVRVDPVARATLAVVRWAPWLMRRLTGR